MKAELGEMGRHGRMELASAVLAVPRFPAAEMAFRPRSETSILVRAAV